MALKTAYLAAQASCSFLIFSSQSLLQLSAQSNINKTLFVQHPKLSRNMINLQSELLTLIRARVWYVDSYPSTVLYLCI